MALANQSPGENAHRYVRPRSIFTCNHLKKVSPLDLHAFFRQILASIQSVAFLVTSNGSSTSANRGFSLSTTRFRSRSTFEGSHPRGRKNPRPRSKGPGDFYMDDPERPVIDASATRSTAPTTISQGTVRSNVPRGRSFCRAKSCM